MNVQDGIKDTPATLIYGRPAPAAVTRQMREAVAGTGFTVRRHGRRHFALLDASGELVAVFVYLKGLSSVAARLAPLSADHVSRLN